MPRISQLPSLTAADNADEIAIVDVSASTTKKITRGDLLKAPLPANSVTTAAINSGAVTAEKIDFATLDSSRRTFAVSTNQSGSITGLTTGRYYTAILSATGLYGSTANTSGTITLTVGSADAAQLKWAVSGQFQEWGGAQLTTFQATAESMNYTITRGGTVPQVSGLRVTII